MKAKLFSHWSFSCKVFVADYLDSQIKPEDLFFLKDEELARQLVELGQRGNGDTMTREEFEYRKKEVEEQKVAVLKPPKVVIFAFFICLLLKSLFKVFSF